MQVYNWILGATLPQEESYSGNQRDGSESRDEVRFEPIVFLAFVEHDLETANRERDQRQPDVVDIQHRAAPAPERDLLLHVWGVFDQPVGQNQGENTHWNVDEENPAPVEIVGEVAAKGRPD